MPRAALFLDRDGVINADYGYVHRIEQVTFLPGIFDLARFVFHELKWPIVIATNQAGIGRGYFDDTQFEILMRWICDRFKTEEAPIARVYHCPYHPEHGIGQYRIDHPWRKPQPGMFLQAARDLDIALGRSALIGDKMTDIEAGAAADVGLLVRLNSKATEPTPIGPPHETVDDLRAAIGLLRNWQAVQTTNDWKGRSD
jgi:D-glycero-D-manno-heptose 1,7-bisphosphate phosphatase